jgi:hypothetical protein
MHLHVPTAVSIAWKVFLRSIKKWFKAKSLKFEERLSKHRSESWLSGRRVMVGQLAHNLEAGVLWGWSSYGGWVGQVREKNILLHRSRNGLWVSLWMRWRGSGGVLCRRVNYFDLCLKDYSNSCVLKRWWLGASSKTS